MTQSPPKKWLFLEHRNNGDKWGVTQYGDWISWCNPEQKLTTGSISNITLQGDRWICILGLSSDENVLLPKFTTALKKPVGIWCHYGGDIQSLGLLENKWTELKLLDNDSKQNLARYLPDECKYPIPFSWGQTTWSWNTEFNQFADRFKPKENYKELIKLLNTAWAKATDVNNLVNRVKVGQDALPAVIALKTLLNLLPDNPNIYSCGDISSAIEQCLIHFDESGGIEFFPNNINGRGSQLSNSYVDLRTSLTKAKNLLNTNTASKDKSEYTRMVYRLENEIKQFCSDYNRFTEQVSKDLTKHPNSPNKGTYN